MIWLEGVGKDEQLHLHTSVLLKMKNELSAGPFLFPHPRFAAPAGAAFLPPIPCPFLGWETLLDGDGKSRCARFCLYCYAALGGGRIQHSSFVNHSQDRQQGSLDLKSKAIKTSRKISYPFISHLYTEGVDVFFASSGKCLLDIPGNYSSPLLLASN